MLSIDRSGNITINRGDTFKVPIFIDVNNTIFHSIRYPFTDHSTIYFYVVPANMPLHYALIKKEYTLRDLNENGDAILTFLHEDTACIPAGTYYYEIKLREKLEEGSSDALVTLSPRRKFIVL